MQIEDEESQAREDRQPEAEGPGRNGGSLLVRWGLVLYGAMAAAAVLWRMGGYGEPILFASEVERGLGIDWSLGLGAGAAAGAALLLFSHVTTRFTRWGDAMGRELAHALGGVSTPDALLLASASGLAEELFFRGALQPRVGWIAASLLFGALHFAPRRALLPWTVFAVVAGLLFGWLFEWTGNLVAPVVAHTLVNAVNLPWLVRRYAEPAA